MLDCDEINDGHSASLHSVLLQSLEFARSQVTRKNMAPSSYFMVASARKHGLTKHWHAMSVSLPADQHSRTWQEGCPDAALFYCFIIPSVTNMASQRIPPYSTHDSETYTE